MEPCPRGKISPLNFNFRDKFPYIACGVFALLLLSFSGRYFPLSEGWWQTYGYLIAGGQKPYIDFPLATPPLFIYYTLLVMKLTQSFFIQRMIGVAVFTGILWLTARWLSCYFSRPVAWIVALTAACFRISDQVFIVNDYHTLVDLLTILALLFFFGISKLRDTGSLVKRYALLGILTALLTLVKQNVGLFLFGSFLLAALLLPACSWKAKVTALAAMCVSYAAMAAGIISMCAPGSVHALLGQILANDAKGSAFTVLTRIFMDSYNASLLLTGAEIYILVLAARIMAKPPDLRAKSGADIAAMAVITALVLGVILTAKLPAMTIRQILETLPLTLCFTVILHIIHKELPNPQRNTEIVFALFPLLALIYCTTHTAWFNCVGMFFVMAFCLGYAAQALGLEHKYTRAAMAAALLFAVMTGVSKIRTPYNWWGLVQDSVYRAGYALPYSQLAGMRVDKKTHDAFAVIKEAIELYAPGNRDVYLFPNIPIFYYLHGKLPPYGNIVQWFDFATGRQLTAEFAAFQKAPPPLIVIFDPPDSAYQKHQFALRKMPQRQVLFRDRFNKLVSGGQYKQVHFSFFANEFRPGNPAFIEPVSRTVVVVNGGAAGMKYSALSRRFGSGRFRIARIIGGDAHLSPSGRTIMHGDRVDIVAGKDIASALVQALGYIEREPQYYTLRILARSDRRPGI
ncbi:MAG: hypothetical protein WC421_08635 [Elusimicrobiales bacterium]